MTNKQDFLLIELNFNKRGSMRWGLLILNKLQNSELISKTHLTTEWNILILVVFSDMSSAAETSLLLVLFLGLAAFSCGIPSLRKRSLLLNMVYICDDDPNLVQLVPETKMAYAKKHFGDAEESREVAIKGMELLDNYQTMTLNTFVSKAYKQLAIFHSIFQDILTRWSKTHQEKKPIVKKLKTIERSTRKLKEYLTTMALFCGQDLPEVTQFNTREIWTKSSLHQKSWILGVLNEFDKNMLYLPSALKMHLKGSKV